MRMLSATLLAAALAGPALAQAPSAGDHAAHHAAALAEGEVRKVDRAAKKITLRHGPIGNLDMPPMTMVFRMQDATLLDQVKVGDRVRFTAEKTGGQYTVIHLEVAR